MAKGPGRPTMMIKPTYTPRAVVSAGEFQVISERASAGRASPTAAGAVAECTIISRRWEIPLLGMIGVTRCQAVRLARVEALVVAGAAVVLGTGIGWRAAPRRFRGAPPLALPPYVAMVTGVLLISLLSTAGPRGHSCVDLVMRPRASKVRDQCYVTGGRGAVPAANRATGPHWSVPPPERRRLAVEPSRGGSR